MPIPTPKDQKKILEQGAEILAQVLAPHDFKYYLVTSGKAHGGAFAQGEFVRSNRKLELHFRYSLGIVNYHIGKQVLSHVSYMRGLLRRNGLSHYPPFSEGPLAGFEALRHDLTEYCSDFIDGNGEQFSECIEKNKKYESLTGLQKMESAQSNI